jgi:hypothetical protein
MFPSAMRYRFLYPGDDSTAMPPAIYASLRGPELESSSAGEQNPKVTRQDERKGKRGKTGTRRASALPPQYGCLLAQFPDSGSPCFCHTRCLTCPSGRSRVAPICLLQTRAGTLKERKGENTLMMVAPGELTPDPAALDIVLETSERLACAALRRPARVRWLAKRKSRDKRYMNEMRLRSCCRSRMGGRGQLSVNS